MIAATIERGGDSQERLYLEHLSFSMPTGDLVEVRATDIPDIDMAALIARNFNRNAAVAVFAKPGHEVLDFPCGSGYLQKMLRRYGVVYEGRDVDPPTIEYARRMYGGHFLVDDLRAPELRQNRYNLIGSIDGIEHIEMQYHDQLIKSFSEALVPGGTLVISTPENPDKVSGPSRHNPYHLGELSQKDFLSLLYGHFHCAAVELVTDKVYLSTSVWTKTMYAICHKWH